MTSDRAFVSSPPIEPFQSKQIPSSAYHLCGDVSKTVFFLHGIGGNKDNWIDQLRFFGAHHFRAIAWDVRGYGDSASFDGPFSFQEISHDLFRLMQQL